MSIKEQHKFKEYIHDIELELMDRLLDSISHNIPYDVEQQIRFKTSSQQNNYKFYHIKEYFKKNSLKNIGFRKSKGKKDRNESRDRKSCENSARPRFRSHDCIKIPHSILKPSSYQLIVLPTYYKSEKKVHFSEKSIFSDLKQKSSKKSHENLSSSQWKVEEHKTKPRQSSLERKRKSHHKKSQESEQFENKQQVQKKSANLEQFIQLQ